MGWKRACYWLENSSIKQGRTNLLCPWQCWDRELGINVDIKATDINGLLEFTKKEKIDLTLAIPDDPLALGIVDLFKENGLRIFGPTKNAAQLESSKAYAKNFMAKYGLPTAKFMDFH